MKKILVVDDSKVITDLIKLMLETSGYSCVGANSANECTQLLQKEKFDLVLLDIAMPEVSGLDVLDAIKNDERQKATKVVLVTAASPTEDEIEGYMAKGAVGLIRKPMKKEFLIELLEKYLGS
ncbi:MAG: response regulator [Nitrososphaerales archaeon]